MVSIGIRYDMGVSKNMGTPKWMVYNLMETLLKWMIWGYPYFWKHLHVVHVSIQGAMFCSTIHRSLNGYHPRKKCQQKNARTSKNDASGHLWDWDWKMLVLVTMVKRKSLISSNPPAHMGLEKFWGVSLCWSEVVFFPSTRNLPLWLCSECDSWWTFATADVLCTQR